MSGLASIAECVLCHQKFAGPAGQIVGEDHASNQIARYMIKLTEHLMEKHPQEMSAIDTTAVAFQGMLRLLNFKTTDAGLRDQREKLRWQVHQMTLNGRITDQTIEAKCDEVAAMLYQKLVDRRALDDHEKDEVLEDFTDVLGPIFRFLRDELEETGRYQGQAVNLERATGIVPQ